MALWAPNLIGWHTKRGTLRIINCAEGLGLVYCLLFTGIFTKRTKLAFRRLVGEHRNKRQWSDDWMLCHCCIQPQCIGVSLLCSRTQVPSSPNNAGDAIIVGFCTFPSRPAVFPASNVIPIYFAS